MSTNPLKVGHIIRVDGDTVEVQLSIRDLRIEYDGRQHRVGRLGTYVTIPMDGCKIIGYVTCVGVHGDLEPGPDPDKPRRVSMTTQLLGTVRNGKFSRGVNEYPTLGEEVLLGVEEDFRMIFGTFDDMAGGGAERKSFSFGRFAVDTAFEVRALGKEFFAKHVAVMGNSGSGKSVTTTKILHEALQLPHTQIIMFDMHGEYRSAFSDDDGEPLPNVTYLSDRNLVLPYWMLRYEEFERIFVDTSDPQNLNAQKVFLRQAFEKLKRPAAVELGLLAEYTIDTPVYYSLDQLKTYAENMNEARFVLSTDNYAFARLPFRQLRPEKQEELLLAQRMEFNRGNSEGEVPHATYFGRLLGLVNQIESRMNDRRYDFLLRPFQQAARNPDIAPFLNEEAGPGVLSRSVSAVISQMLGRLNDRKNLTIVDLSGLPFDVIDITVASLTRTLFDFNFWAPPEVRQPFVLVFEEAHNYLPRVDRAERMFSRDAVEKVAKEGRKYGVSAMVVTQRPSEISETILSQCNSMVLMRMNNPDDQNYVARVVSDQFRSLISLLPSMKPGEGFVIGDSVLMPMRTLIDMPPRLPRSGDVDFFGMWGSGTGTGNVDEIVERWWRQDRSSINAQEPLPPDPLPAVPVGEFVAEPDAPGESLLEAELELDDETDVDVPATDESAGGAASAEPADDAAESTPEEKAAQKFSAQERLAALAARLLGPDKGDAQS
jgi:DNA helicase HerA-like ATPase